MAKNAKKRGVKPGTKRGPYKKSKSKIVKGLEEAVFNINIPNAEWRNVQDKAIINKDYKVISPTNMITLCGQLDEAISNLEIRISNSIAKINSLM